MLTFIADRSVPSLHPASKGSKLTVTWPRRRPCAERAKKFAR